MVPALIAAALRNRWLVLAVVAWVGGLGFWSLQNQKIDAYPDISGQMVQVITTYPGRAPEEVERRVTIPLELGLGNVPRVEVIRSRTIFGLSVVQLMFEEGVENYWARQRVDERLRDIELPPEATASMGPLATAYGEVYRYELKSRDVHDLMELRTLNDWFVIPRLLRARGVAEVSNFGGLAKQFAVKLQPYQLIRFGLTLSDVLEALKINNADAGGSVMTRGSMSFVIRGRGALQDLAAIGATFVKSVGGTPIYLRDIADIDFDHKVPSGIFSKDATPEAVEGIVLMRRGENPSEVLRHVKDAIDELNTSMLPEGVRVEPFYDRNHLVASTLHTVTHSVLLGITLVILVLLLFMGRPAIAALVALTIPFSLLFALVLMSLVNIPIGLLSVGAIDFGIIVDGAVIMADSIAHRLGTLKHGTSRRNIFKAIQAAAIDVERPVFFSVMMIIATYMPLLTLRRIEGLLFRPMALTIVFALVGALLFALLVVPVLASFFFGRGYREWENPLLHRSRPIYAAILRAFLRRRWIVATAVLTLVGGIIVIIAPRLGTEFLPYMDEGVVWVRANFPEGTSLEQTAQFGARIREMALEFPDIKTVTAQSGRNDSGTDPFPASRMEIMIIPYPREQWTRFATKADMLRAIGSRFRAEFPTTRFNFTQPIIDSVTEDTNGTSANLAVEFSGPDSDVLLQLSQKTVELLRQMPGATDVNIEQEGPQPQLLVQPDRALCARYNVRIEDVTRMINNALGGEPIGTLYEKERRFPIVVKFEREVLKSPEAIGRLIVHTSAGVPVPLAQVATIEIIDGQTLIARQNNKRRLTVRCDIVGRDQGGFVAEAQRRFNEVMQIPQGYHVAWLGMFENLDRARRHFIILIPLTVALVFALLAITFHSYRSALLLLLLVPFSFIGGAIALYVRQMNLNVSTGVGFAALFGVSLMDGVLMVRAVTNLRLQGLGLDEAIIEGALTRLRPILMTALVAILGLLPASLATGLGSDVQRPLATVIVWGLFSAMILTLFVLPVFYRIVRPPLPEAPREEPGAEFVQPLPDVLVHDVLTLLEHLQKEGGEGDLFQVADAQNLELGRLLAIVKAADMLDLVDTQKQRLALTQAGREMVQATIEERRALWNKCLLQLSLFHVVHQTLQAQPDRTLDRDFVVETIITHMPSENYENMYNTFVRWSRFGHLFEFDEENRQIRLP
jgi:cobalt-zinc-cadmium resistance protein CzcA